MRYLRALRQGARSHKAADNRYGGPVYAGPADLVTAGSLISAGGGAKAFSTRFAFGRIIGPQLVDPEPRDVTQRIRRRPAVETWQHSFDSVVRRAAELSTDGGVIFPLASASHTGKALFIDIMHDGMDPGGTFWTGTMLDKPREPPDPRTDDAGPSMPLSAPTPTRAITKSRINSSTTSPCNSASETRSSSPENH